MKKNVFDFDINIFLWTPRSESATEAGLDVSGHARYSSGFVRRIQSAKWYGEQGGVRPLLVN